MKRILIISPYFPPTNAADMHRVRMSLPYFKKFGWTPEVVTVDPAYSDLIKDPVLMKSVPENIKIHYVNAFRKSWTSKTGFGNIGYRSIWFYKKYVDKLLNDNKFDLIYFSTTQFPICILGRYWKKKWKVPYVIDIQDMWHSEYYKSRPKTERPPKYWLSYPVNKYLEAVAMNHVDGLISVSKNYLDLLKQRYPRLEELPSETITFGVSNADFTIAKQNHISPVFQVDASHINLVYVGRGGYDLSEALKLLFEAFKILINENQKADKIRFHFLGTSYAPSGSGKYTIMPLATAFGLQDYVYEQTDRLGFYQTIASLLAADVLFVPGSNDPNYTASKVFPYILAERPLFSIFNSQSSAVKILNECSNADVVLLDAPAKNAIKKLKEILTDIINGKTKKMVINNKAFQSYTSESLTKKQTELFDSVIIRN